MYLDGCYVKNCVKKLCTHGGYCTSLTWKCCSSGVDVGHKQQFKIPYTVWWIDRDRWCSPEVIINASARNKHLMTLCSAQECCISSAHHDLGLLGWKGYCYISMCLSLGSVRKTLRPWNAGLQSCGVFFHWVKREKKMMEMSSVASIC